MQDSSYAYIDHSHYLPTAAIAYSREVSQFQRPGIPATVQYDVPSVPTVLIA